MAAPDAIYSDRSGYGYCLLRLANLAHAAADTARATRCAEQALEAFTPLGEQRGLAMAHSVLAQPTWTAAQPELAARHRDQAFRAVSAIPMIGTVEDTVFALIEVEIAHGRPRAAAQLIGSWHSANEAFHGDAILNEYATETIDRVRSQLPAAAYHQAWSRGRGIPLADAVESLRVPAAEQPEQATARTGAADRWQLLSRREREVVRLIAGGKADKEIAAELGISVTTAHTHVRNILRRTGCRNRAEAATLAPTLAE